MQERVPTSASPPRLDEYPTGTLVAIVDDLDQAADAVAAVSPLSADKARVLQAEEVIAQDRTRADRQGTAERAYLSLASLVSDQGEIQQQYVEQARRGRHMVVAEAQDDQQADDIWATLKAHGAHHGTFFAGATVRELV